MQSVCINIHISQRCFSNTWESNLVLLWLSLGWRNAWCFTLYYGLPWWRIRLVSYLGWEDPLEKIAAHSSILAWRIPWTEEPGGSMGSQRVGQAWETNTFPFFLFYFIFVLFLSNFHPEHIYFFPSKDHKNSILRSWFSRSLHLPGRTPRRAQGAREGRSRPHLPLHDSKRALGRPTGSAGSNAAPALPSPVPGLRLTSPRGSQELL